MAYTKTIINFAQREFSLLPVLVILREGRADGRTVRLLSENAWMQKKSIKAKFIILFLCVLVIHSHAVNC